MADPKTPAENAQGPASAPEKPRTGGKMPYLWLWFALLVVVVCGIGAFFVLQSRTPDSPTRTLQDAWMAFNDHNLPRFEQDVDIEKLSQSLVSQATTPEGTTPQGALDSLKNALTQGVMGLVRPELQDRFSGQIRDLVDHGTFSNEGAEKGIIPTLWAQTGAVPATFSGMALVSSDPSQAVVTLSFDRNTDVAGATLKLDVLLAKNPADAKSQWQVVGIQGLDAFMRSLDALQKQQLESINAPIRQALSSAVTLVQAEKSAGKSAWGIGQGVMLHLTYKNTGDKPIKYFTATVTITNKQTGDVLRTVDINDVDGIAPGQVVEKVWPITVNPLSSDDEKVYTARADQVAMTMQVNQVTYADDSMVHTFKTLADARAAGAVK